MESTKLNSWLTLAANIGVILGLLLLVVEIRQNTAASRAQTAQAIIDSSRNFLVGIAMDENFARLRESGQSDVRTFPILILIVSPYIPAETGFTFKMSGFNGLLESLTTVFGGR